MDFVESSTFRGVTVGVGIVFIAGVLLSACSPDTADDGRESSASKGAQVFSENCAVCHAGGRAPATSDLKSLSSADRADRIRNHPQAGPITDRLTAKELLDLIEYLENVSPGTSEPTGPSAAMFVDRCGACHSGAGRGPSFLELSQLSREQFEKQWREHPVAGTIPQRLSAGELVDLIAYLDSK